MRKYIENRAEELSEWDVLFAGVKRDTPESLVYDLHGLRVVCQRRSLGSILTIQR